MTTFGRLLAARRRAAGLSQNELARKAGIDPAYPNRLEHGTLNQAGKPSRPSREIVLALALALGLDRSDTDRFLYASDHAPLTDWQTRYEQLEARIETWLTEQCRVPA